MDNHILADPSIEWIQNIDGVARAPVASGEHHLIIHSYDRFTKEYIVRRFDRESGHIQWSAYLPAGGYASPTVGDGTIFIPCGYSQICALDEQTGKKLWQYDLHSRNRSTPTFFDGMAIIGTANRLYAFNSQGNIVKQSTYAGNIFFGNPLVDTANRRVFLASLQNPSGQESRAIVSAIDLDTLELLWHTDVGTGIMVSSDTAGLGCADDTLFVGTKEGISCLDFNTGEVLWAVHESGIMARSAPFVYEDTVYTGTLSGDIVGYNTKTGERLFSAHLDDEGVWCPPVVYDGYLWVHAGVDVFLLNPSTGETVSKLAIGHGPYTAFKIAGGKLYIAAGDPPDWSYLYCMRLSNTPKLSVDTVVVDYNLQDDGEDSDTLTARFSISTADGILPDRLIVDARIFGGSETVEVQRVRPREYQLKWTIPKFNRYGNYALPLTGEFGNRRVRATLPLYLRSKAAPHLPTSYVLDDFALNQQEQPYFSGPAVLQAVMARLGRDITQGELNQMGEFMDGLGVDPHHKWRSGSVRILQSSKNSLT